MTTAVSANSDMKHSSPIYNHVTNGHTINMPIRAHGNDMEDSTEAEILQNLRRITEHGNTYILMT